MRKSGPGRTSLVVPFVLHLVLYIWRSKKGLIRAHTVMALSTRQFMPLARVVGLTNWMLLLLRTRYVMKMVLTLCQPDQVLALPWNALKRGL